MAQIYGYHGSRVGSVAMQFAGLHETIEDQKRQIAAVRQELRQAHIKNAQLMKENAALKRNRRYVEREMGDDT